MSELIEEKTAGLIGPALDWAVAKARGWQMVRVPTDIDGNFGGEVLAPPDFSSDFKFPNRGRVGAAFFLRRWSTDWSQGGPLIEKYRPDMQTGPGGKVGAYLNNNGGDPAPLVCCTGETYLIALCRAIAFAKLGDTVQVPKELMP